MLRVDFEHAGGAATDACESEPGERLLDLVDRVGAPVRFDCRAANCGSCLVEVVAGAELLSPVSDDERAVLELFDASVSHRLACQPTLIGRSGVVRLRIVRPPRWPSPPMGGRPDRTVL